MNVYFCKDKSTQCVNHLILIFSKTIQIFTLLMGWATKKVKC